LKKKQKEFIGSINILIEKVGDLLDEDFLEEANKVMIFLHFFFCQI
jgi:hypothetical protein